MLPAPSPQPSAEADCREPEGPLLQQVQDLGPQRIRSEQATIRGGLRRGDGRGPRYTSSFRSGDPACHVGECLRRTHRTLLCLVDVVAIETETRGPELHAVHSRSSAERAIGAVLYCTRTRAWSRIRMR